MLPQNIKGDVNLINLLETDSALLETKLRENIKYHRECLGWSLPKLSEEIHATRQTISKWEKGTANPTIIDVLQLCKVFGCDPCHLLGEYDDCKKRDTQFIHDATGLDESAILRLHKAHKEKRIPVHILNMLLTNDRFYDALWDIENAIVVQQSGPVNFTPEMTTKIINTLGPSVTADVGFNNLGADTNFDGYIAMLATLAPNLTVMSREESAKHHLAEAAKKFREATDEIALEKQPKGGQTNGTKK